MSSRGVFDLTAMKEVLNIYSLSDSLEKALPDKDDDFYQYVYFVHQLSTVNTRAEIFVDPRSNAVGWALDDQNMLKEKVDLFIKKQKTDPKLFGVNRPFKDYVPYLQTAGLMLYPKKEGKAWVRIALCAVLLCLVVVLSCGEYASWAVMTKWNTTSVTMQLVRNKVDKELVNLRLQTTRAMDDVNQEVSTLRSSVEELAAHLDKLQTDLESKQSALDAIGSTTAKAIADATRATQNLTRSMAKHVGLVEAELKESLHALNETTTQSILEIGQNALQTLNDEETKMRRNLADVWAEGFANVTNLSRVYNSIATRLVELSDQIQDQKSECNDMIQKFHRTLGEATNLQQNLALQAAVLVEKLTTLERQAQTTETQVKEIRQSVGDFSNSAGGCLFFVLVCGAVCHVLYNQLMMFLDQGYYVLVKNPSHQHFVINNDGTMAVMQLTQGDGLRKLLQICVLLGVFGCVFHCYMAVKAVSDRTIHAIQNPGKIAADGLIGTVSFGVNNTKEFFGRIVNYWN